MELLSRNKLLNRSINQCRMLPSGRYSLKQSFGHDIECALVNLTEAVQMQLPVFKATSQWPFLPDISIIPLHDRLSTVALLLALDSRTVSMKLIGKFKLEYGTQCSSEIMLISEAYGVKEIFPDFYRVFAYFCRRLRRFHKVE